MRSLRVFITGLLILLVIALLLLYFSPLSILVEGPRNLIISFFNRPFNYQVFQELRLENESLKIEINQLKEVIQADLFLATQSNYLIADLYSRYPFNDQASLIVNLGSIDGLKPGMPVLAAKGVLLGRVVEVKRVMSEIQTIFDPAWRSSVAIGDNGGKAVLVGGFTPRLELISRQSSVQAEDIVINVAPEFPYGLTLGRLGNLEEDVTAQWFSATLQIFYNLNNLKEVLIVTDHESL